MQPREHRQKNDAELQRVRHQLASAHGELDRAERDRRAGDLRERLLLAELHRRVANNLAVIRSIFSRTANGATSTEDLIEHFRGRLDAVARTQVATIRLPGGDVELEDLVRDELLDFGLSDGPMVSIAGPPVPLRQDAVELLSLTIHELATNAAKFGMLAAAGASLDVRWSIEGSPDAQWLVFIWRESGVGIVSLCPRRFGFGRDLIERGLPYQLSAVTTFELRPGGVVCTIRLPLGRIAGDRSAVS